MQLSKTYYYRLFAILTFYILLNALNIWSSRLEYAVLQIVYELLSGLVALPQPAKAEASGMNY